MSDDFYDSGADDFAPVPGDVLTTTPNISYVNEAGVPEETVEIIRGMREVASVIERWNQSLISSTQDTPTFDLFNRNRWKGANHIFAVMDACQNAVENDDILSTLADVTEGLAFPKMRFEMIDKDQEDMWNQWAGEVDLDTRLREQFRDLFKVSQFYVGLLWEQRIYNVRDSAVNDRLSELEKEAAERERQRAIDHPQIDPVTGQPVPPPPAPPEAGPGRGNRRRKKKFAVTVPTEMTLFSPTKVIPVGSLMFNRERFAYIANDGEHEAFSEVMAGDAVDDTVLRLIERRYEPAGGERKAMEDLGINPERLWLFKRDAIYRHTVTKAQYERFANPRLKPILHILDMKSHLRASDRASLVGNTNFIVVIKKGTDKLPAKAAEIANLQEQAKVVARMPILVGDHRLSVEIVSPALDNTLIESRWQVLDSRLVFKALQTFSPVVQGGNSSGSGVSEMSRIVARGIENRRHEMIRSLEASVFREVLKRNEGVLDETPSLTFTPKRVALDYNTDIVNAILKLRDRGDLSRETMLEELDYDQEVEALRRADEKARFDEVFKSSVPHSSPGTNPFGGGQPPAAKQAEPPSVTGARGGRPPGVKEAAPRKPADA